MKYCFLLPALLLAAPAAAQVSATPPRPDTTVAQAAPDTVAALHRLFAAKRQRGSGFLGAALGIALASGTFAETTRRSAQIGDLTPFFAIVLCVVSIPVATAEAVDLRLFSRRNEQRAVEAFEQHHLVDRIRRQLRPVHFYPASPADQ